MATAIADAAAARRDYLDETGGRYVHLIADGGVATSGDIAKSIGCGADAVMLGEPLSLAEGARRAGELRARAALQQDADRPFGPDRLQRGPAVVVREDRAVVRASNSESVGAPLAHADAVAEAGAADHQP